MYGEFDFGLQDLTWSDGRFQGGLTRWAIGHGVSEALCGECDRLLAYANGRLERCPFGAKKPSCGHCPVHCYKPAMRRQIKDVMRYAGPRMLYRHPILAILHLWDSFRRDKGTK